LVPDLPTLDHADAMFYTRGPADDFDRYALVTGDSGWSWKNLLKYIKKVRNLFGLSGTPVDFVLE